MKRNIAVPKKEINTGLPHINNGEGGHTKAPSYLTYFVTVLTIFFISSSFDIASGFAPSEMGAGTSLLPVPDSPVDLIKGVEDSVIFRKSSIMKRLQVTKGKGRGAGKPEFYLNQLTNNRVEDSFEIVKQDIKAGVTVSRFQQMYAGLPVFGGEVVMRLSEKEGFVILTGYYFKGIRIATWPIYTPKALKDIIVELLGGGRLIGESPLGVLPADDEYHLCYKLNIRKGPIEDYIFYMDAESGDVLRAFSRVTSTN